MHPSRSSDCAASDKENSDIDFGRENGGEIMGQLAAVVGQQDLLPWSARIEDPVEVACNAPCAAVCNHDILMFAGLAPAGTSPKGTAMEVTTSLSPRYNGNKKSVPHAMFGFGQCVCQEEMQQP